MSYCIHSEVDSETGKCSNCKVQIHAPPVPMTITQIGGVDMVNHPPHYTSHPSGVECITVTEHMNFNNGNAVKYIWRADEKGNALEDLEKARWYIEREIQRRKKMK